jgi:Uma2 family endonuclease
MSIYADSRLKLSYEDYVGFPDDGRRHEIIDGVHHVTPSPDSFHQTLVMRLAYPLYVQVDLMDRGRVLPSPMDVVLTPVDIVQPDILVVLAPKTRHITAKNVECAPDLVLEILSESTRDRDLRLKKSLYERTGVREYWIVDPEAHAVEQLTLDAHTGRFSSHGTFREEVVSEALGLRVNLREVW